MQKSSHKKFQVFDLAKNIRERETTKDRRPLEGNYRDLNLFETLEQKRLGLIDSVDVYCSECKTIKREQISSFEFSVKPILNPMPMEELWALKACDCGKTLLFREEREFDKKYYLYEYDEDNCVDEE
ncbi:MAG: hypothetical protein Q8K60_07125 [Parachlamydiaceae bacterium]|nr:hypothetical protein [Parachlamydiaceae bacterium]